MMRKIQERRLKESREWEKGGRGKGSKKVRKQKTDEISKSKKAFGEERGNI